MRKPTRTAIALLGSLAIHGLPVGLALTRLIPSFDVDLEFELMEVEILDPNQLQGDDAAPKDTQTPEPEVTDLPEPEPEPEPKPEPEPAPEPKDLLRGRTSQVDQLGPTNSTFFALLVPKKIRRLSFADQALDVMAPLPDFAYLISGGGFDALRDFDYIVIASSDVRDWTQTFLAVTYNVSTAEVQRSIERAARARGEVVEWIEDGAVIRGNPRPVDPNEPDVDSRWFVLLPDRVAIYVRAEFLPKILSGDVGEDKTAANYVANLAHLRKFAARQPTTGLQAVVRDLHRAVRRSKGLPFALPDIVEVSVEATEEPELLIRLGFASREEAAQFHTWWDDDFPGTLLGFRDQIEVTRKNESVRLWARFSTEQATLLLTIVSSLSAKVVGKTPEEVEADRHKRQEYWRLRHNGKLPPSAIDGEGNHSTPPTTDSPVDPAPATDKKNTHSNPVPS